ncbi:hypothetical protein GcM3_116023 [Golovinomyces cichoracearum]|uniref:Uncharacterized protein n=1 Tax=Golovinomyces cichoracearum TaxID=62708 RepID=A0A420I854_9PEZI|nr:hypothetical protein GcM3_116023 [Golovinomyces cichoracearum]
MMLFTLTEYSKCFETVNYPGYTKLLPSKAPIPLYDLLGGLEFQYAPTELGDSTELLVQFVLVAQSDSPHPHPHFDFET